MISKEEFIIQHLTEDKKYQDIIEENPGLTESNYLNGGKRNLN